MQSAVVTFLGGILTHVRSCNGDELRNWLRVDAGAPGIYFQLAQELKSTQDSNDELQEKVDKYLPEVEDVKEGQGSPWPGFNSFIKEYLIFWREVDFNNLVALHSRASELLVYVPSCSHIISSLGL